jgi:hypothetical protein
VVLAAQEPGHGIQPRAGAEDYATKAQADGQIYAASLVPADRVKHLFAFDISKSYVVFEVACYSGDHPSAEVEPESFVVKTGKKGDVVRQADAATVAADVQRQNTPKLPSRAPAVYTEANVGYENGTDPYTGRRVHDVYTGGGVGVASGQPADGGPRYPTPGGTPQDRELLESQLQQRALPGGKFDHAVAGYLYFFRSSVKKDSKGSYVLEYSTDSSQTVRLTVPSKP